jgi:hypothetical protein
VRAIRHLNRPSAISPAGLDPGAGGVELAGLEALGHRVSRPLKEDVRGLRRRAARRSGQSVEITMHRVALDDHGGAAVLDSVGLVVDHQDRAVRPLDHQVDRAADHRPAHREHARDLGAHPGVAELLTQGRSEEGPDEPEGELDLLGAPLEALLAEGG